MRRFQVLRAVIIAAQFSCFAVTTSQAQALTEGELVTPVARRGVRWGAVARFEGSFFGAWGYSSEAEARRAAISNCEKQHGKGNCSYSTISGSECWALARAVPDRGGWGQGIAVTIEDAVDLAMKHCTDGADSCKKSFTFCADGSDQFNDR